GYENRFRDLSREDLLKYYNRMYAPNRMAIAIVGDVNVDDILAKAQDEFKNFRQPNYDVIGLSPREPAQIEKRSAQKNIETNLAYLAIGYHSTSVLSEDLFALDLLSMIVGRGDNSRLNSSLVKRQRLAHIISCWNLTPRDPGMFVVTAVLDADKIPGVEEAIYSEIAKLRSGVVIDEELEGAKRMVLGDFIFAQETLDAQADSMTSDYLLTGSHDFSRRYVRGIQAVSAEQLKRVANKYLRNDGATVVTIVPADFTEEPEGKKVSSADELPARTLVLPNGLKIAIRRNAKTPTVSITAVMRGGLTAETKEDNGISNFTANMLLKGTSKRREDQISGAIEKLGGSITAFSGSNGFGITEEFLEPDIDTAVSILRDILSDSVFPEEQLEKERELILAEIREEESDIFDRGFTALRKETFGVSPYAFRALGEEVVVKALARKDLVNFYKKYAVPNNMIISISGDVEPDALADRLAKAFSGLQAKDLPKEARNQTPPGKINVRRITMGKEQSLIALGFMTTDVKDPDRYVLDVLGSVLSGYSGRLFSALRDRDPLAYTLGSFQRPMLDTGFFALYAATSKENIPAAEKALIKEIALIVKDGVSEDELILAKRELICGREIKMQTNGYFSQTTAIDEMYGLGYDNIFKYEEGIGKVTKDDVKRVAGKYFDLNGYSEVVITGE
ncbi:MAG: pitrilysin family protein, partial [Candidatus Omnitrophica bacterium]|nr:pitrilysin family protein [Candidatus Omnitrophota bacterium]